MGAQTYRYEDANDRWSGRGRRAKLGSATYDEDDDQAYAYGSSSNRWGSDEPRYLTGDDERDDAPEHSSLEDQDEEGPIKAERNRNRTGKNYEPSQRRDSLRNNGSYEDGQYPSRSGGKGGERNEDILARDGDSNYGGGRQLHRDDPTRSLRGNGGGNAWHNAPSDDDNDAQMGDGRGISSTWPDNNRTFRDTKSEQNWSNPQAHVRRSR